jgi:DNA-binding MarR family transcriptional regulator
MPARSDDIFQQTIDRFWESVPPVWNLVKSNVRSVASQQFGVTVEQFHLLRAMRRRAHTISELAQIGRISRPAISQAVDALVHKGLVSRRQRHTDRRYVTLELTAEGTALLEAIFKQTRAWMMTKLASLEEDELRSVMTGMALLRQAFEDAQE